MCFFNEDLKNRIESNIKSYTDKYEDEEYLEIVCDCTRHYFEQRFDELYPGDYRKEEIRKFLQQNRPTNINHKAKIEYWHAFEHTSGTASLFGLLIYALPFNAYNKQKIITLYVFIPLCLLVGFIFHSYRKKENNKKKEATVSKMKKYIGEIVIKINKMMNSGGNK